LKDLAEEIEIINVGGESGVASEATLKQLLAAMNRMAGGGSSGAAAEAKARKLANDAMSAGTQLTKESNKATEDDITATKKAARATNELSEKMGRLAAQGVKQAAESLYELGKTIVGGTTSNIADFTKHIPVFGSALTSLASIVDETVDSYRSFSEIGAGFGGSLTEMRRAAADSGMYLDEFAQFMANNSSTMMLLGTTVSEGAKRFNNMNAAIRSSGDLEGLAKLGFTLVDVNEGMAEYVELQGMMGHLQGRSTRDLANGSAQYLEQLDRLSKLTGKSRKELAERMAQEAGDYHTQAMLAGMSAEQQMEYLGALEEVGARMPFLKDAVKDLADGVAQTPLGQKLQAFAPAVAEAAAALGRGEISQAEFMRRMHTEGGPQLRNFVNNLSAAQRAALATEEGFGELFGGMGELNKFLEASYDPAAAKAEQDAAKARQEKLLQFDNTIREVREKIKMALIDSGIFDLLLDTIGMVADGISSIAQAIAGFTEKISNGDVIGALKDLLGGAPAIAAVVGGIAALFAAKAVAGALASGIGGMMGKLTSGISNKIGGMFGSGAGPASQAVSSAPKGGSKGGGFAKGAGNAGKGIGNFIGNMGSGIMKGAAAGLRAFANPAILVGAGILAGAIVLIGGAIAGATWLLGKALPSLAEGLQSFGDIDGGNLLRVAGGMAALGGALAVFGAGAAVGAIGNTIANILDALPGKGPLEKLVEFSNVPINAAKVKANAEALSAYGKALAAQGGGAALGAIGNTAANIVSGVVGMFGGSTEPPWDKIKEFGELQLNTQGIIANAGAVKAYAVAIADFPQTPAPSLLSSFKTGVASFFGAETDPFAPIRNFGNTRLNTRQIISNAGAVSAYAVAIKDFPQTPAPSLLSSFKTGVASFFGAETDPFAPIKRFGDTTLNTAQIISNAGAVKAYAVAIKDFPESPQASVLGAFKSGLASLLGGDSDPMEPIKRFGELQLNTAQIIANAYAVSAYATAIKDFPESPQASVLGAFKGGLASLLGGDKDPMEPIKRFGDLTLNTAGITANAAAVKAYADAIKDFPESPQANVLSAFKGGLASLLGGDKDPMAPIKRFGDLTLNTTGIKANAEAVSAYATAIKDFPESPSTTLLNSFRTGIASLLGGETDPMAPIKTFGDLTLNTAGIKANAEAVSAYALAIKDFPESPATTILTSLRTGIASLLGGETDPFAPMKRFGDLSLNTTGITANAGAVKAFADAMANMPQVDSTRSGGVLGAMKDWFAGEEEMPWDAVSKFGSAKINVDGVTNNAAAINAMSTSLSNFALEKLDSEGIISYTNSIKDLVAQLKALNVELKKDNDGLLTDRASAGELLNNISLSTSAGAGNTGEVASLLQQLIELTMQQLELDEKIEKNTKDARGSNLLTSNVTMY